VIKVHKYGPAFGLPDASPFVIKVETYLRIVGEPYEEVLTDVRKMPRKQLPCATIDGTIVPDSTAIIERLEARRSAKLDAHLDARERAIAFAFKTMLEEYLYFGVLYLRWTTDDGWRVFEPGLREMLGKLGVPSMFRGLVSGQARKQVTARHETQGIGRKPREELVASCKEVIDSLSVYLGDHPFLCGDKPTTYDATAYAFVAGVLAPAFKNELRDHLASKQNLVAYDNRMKAAYWSRA
jgi:glutathione S-transferase